ncbi:BBE domain-containing protein [Streptomyces sp. NPDC001262]|uniref:BBE domain-containing protein n=1 Tax=Streptomyces TaxID=1883 RepID=UPI00367512B2
MSEGAVERAVEGTLIRRGDPGYESARTDAAAVRRSYAPAAWDRLQELKARWDPENLFRSCLAP